MRFLSISLLLLTAPAGRCNPTCNQQIVEEAYFRTQIALRLPWGVWGATCSDQELASIGQFLNDEFDSVAVADPAVSSILATESNICAQAENIPSCCSWDNAFCDENSAYCNASVDNCLNQCNGDWINPADSVMCNARWQTCRADHECCGNNHCLWMNDGMRMCETPGENPNEIPEPDFSVGCCSINLKTCHYQESDYCSFSVNNCESICDGNWIDPSNSDASCIARWASGCNSDSDCCGHADHGAICKQNNGQTQCALPTDGQRARGLLRSQSKSLYNSFVKASSNEEIDERSISADASYQHAGRLLGQSIYFAWNGDITCTWCKKKDQDGNTGYDRERRMQEEAGFETVEDVVWQLQRDANVYLTSKLQQTYSLDPNSCLYMVQAEVRTYFKEEIASVHTTCNT